MGRVFPAAENQPGTDGVALLSHGLWKRRFGSDRNVLGSTIRVDGLPHTVIGVLPESFAVVLLNGTPDWSVPMEHVMRGRGERRFAVFHGAAQLKPGASLAQAQSEMDSIAAALEAETPHRNRGRGVMLVPLRREIAGEVKPALMVLLGAVACVLLIACANVANLLLARSLVKLRGVDPGFRSASILTMHLPLAETRYRDKTQRAALADQLLERIRALPPVESAAFTNSLPIAAGWTVSSGASGPMRLPEARNRWAAASGSAATGVRSPVSSPTSSSTAWPRTPPPRPICPSPRTTSRPCPWWCGAAPIRDYWRRPSGASFSRWTGISPSNASRPWSR